MSTTLLDAITLDSNNIDSSTSCKAIPTPSHLHKTTTMLHTKPHYRKWNPIDFVYIDGSRVKGNTIIGAGVIDMKANTTTHVEVKSQSERLTINIAGLAAIILALRQENTKNYFKIPINSS